ncbi:ribosomal RNA processing protein 1 homolog A isoform X1 [Antechinus flavipes]|uniref:ribosomal RNA processing protein 1 homolog A isoform X1 n=2 Tax=Antechinus flavipes TaxID=38775 RepID=UPI00223664C6|nr:ribosomal RNA processing protein 1 homolog A isoform X1 [Antechinus flavipes]
MAPAPALPSEIQLAQRLAGNEKTIRDRAVRKLRRYIRAKTEAASGGFSHDELLKIWKGLFYCMWMQDKPLLQEELGNTISQLIHVFQNTETQHLFVQTFWQTMNREWIGIDRLRLDKFYMLMRLLLNQSFEALKRSGWEESQVELLLDILMKEILHPDSQAPCGVKSHFIDIYLEELTKVGAEELTADQNLKFVIPFCKIASRTKDSTLLYNIVGGIFDAILEQAPFAIEDLIRELNANQEDSELLETESDDMTSIRLHGKQKKGKKGKDSFSSEDKPKVKKQSNGKGHIGLVLQFNYEEIADRLFEMASRQSTPSLNRKHLYKLVRKFQSLAEGIFPQDGLPRRKKLNKNRLQQKKTRLPKSKLKREKGKKDEKQNIETDVPFEKDKSRTTKRKEMKKRKHMSTDSSFPYEKDISDTAIPLNPQNDSSGRPCKRKKIQGPKVGKVSDGFQENKNDETETQKHEKKQELTDLEVVMPAIRKNRKKDACKKIETKKQQKKNLDTPLQTAFIETPAVKRLPAHPLVSPKPESNVIGTSKLVTKHRKKGVHGSNHIASQKALKVSSNVVHRKELSRNSDLTVECQDIDNTRMIKKKHKWISRDSVVPPQQDMAKLSEKELATSTENLTDCDFLPPSKRPNRNVSRSAGSLNRKTKRILWSLGPRMLFRSPGRRVKRNTRKDL